MWSNAGSQSETGGWYKNAVVVAGTTTLDPATLNGAAVALSNGNLTVTSTAGSNAVTRSVASHSSGKYYCEFTPGRTVNTCIGVASTGVVNTEYMSQTSSTAGIGFGGTIWQGNSLTGTTTAPALVNGHVYGLAIDVGNRTAWAIDLTAAGTWNANGTANPATNTNGCGLTGNMATGALCVALSVNDATDNVTFNFGASAYTGTPPSGFGNW